MKTFLLLMAMKWMVVTNYDTSVVSVVGVSATKDTTVFCQYQMDKDITKWNEDAFNALDLADGYEYPSLLAAWTDAEEITNK